MKSIPYLVLLCFLFPVSCASTDQDEDWIDLFNGKDLSGWTFADGSPVTRGWQVKEGVIHLPANCDAGSIFTEKVYLDFELRFEWKAAPRANSGVKYRVARYGEELLGPEYQVLDDMGLKNEIAPLTRAAALYALKEADPEKPLLPAGQYNRGRIRVKGSIFEHWLNGKKVMEVDISSPDYRARLQRSKFRDHPDYGARRGRIMLQNHSDEVWYRGLKIREG
jgi:hypothetical protein